MGYFDRHPAQFRVLLAVLGLYLTGIGVLNLVFIISTPTDENLFMDPPSSLYIVRDVPASLESRTGLSMTPRFIDDTVRAGNLLVAVDGETVRTTAEAAALLDRGAADYSTIIVHLLRENTSRTFRVRRSAVPDNFLRDIPPTAYVVDVLPGGASDQAGMQVGDLIISINGQRFGDVLEADKIMRRGQAGTIIAYEILRNNTTLTLNLTLSRVRFPLPLVTVLLCGLIYIGTGWFIGLQRPNLKAARLLSLAFLCIGYIWLASSSGGTATPPILNLLRALAYFFAIFFGIAFWQHSALYFPAEQPALLAKPWLYRISYILATGFTLSCIVLALLGGTNLNMYILAGSVVLFLYSVSSALTYRKLFSAEYKRMIRPIHLTASAALGIVIVITLLNQFFPEAQTAWTLTFITGAMAAVPLMYLYVIGRYRLLGLALRVRRTIQYTVLSTVWKASLLIIALSTLYLLTQLDLDVPNLRFTGTAVEIPKEPITVAERMVLEKITLMLAAVCFTFAFWEIGRAGQNYINRIYYRSEYDYKQAAADFADVIATRLTLDGLADGIVHTLADRVHLKRTGIFMFRDGKLAQYSAYTVDGEEQTTDAPSSGTPSIDTPAFIEALQQFHGGFSVDYLPRGLKEALRERNFLHVVPVRSKDRIIGAITIGEKLSEAAVEREDLAFLEAVSRQAAVAIENALLYEEIAGQERLRHELALAREIQLASLPQTTPDIRGLDIAGCSCPATEVGGDYFDYLNGAPGSITVIVGDVSGKGTSAALYMSKVQGILRSLHAFDLSPRELLVRTNQLLYNDLEKKGFVTAISAAFDTTAHRITIARAGHLPMLHYCAASGTIQRVLPRGMGLGIVASSTFSTHIDEEGISYKPGDIFLFVTDGITEAMNEQRQEFGEEQLLDILQAHTHEPAEGIRDAIREAVQHFTGQAALHDDFTVVVVKAAERPQPEPE